MTETEMTYRPEFLEVVALLDKDRPGWHRRVDLSVFTLGGFTHCICGQVYGPGMRRFKEAFESLGISLRSNDDPRSQVFADMTYEDEWRRLILERTEADRVRGMEIGVPQREFTEEPLEVPGITPSPPPEPEETPLPQREPEREPVHA